MALFGEQDEKTIDQESIKKANRERIFELFLKKRVLTKQETSQQTEISFPTVSNIIDYFVENGFAEEAGMAVSTGGRKPVMYRFLPNARYSFGINIEPGSIRIVRTNLDINILDDFSFPVKNNYQENDLAGIIAPKFKEIVERSHVKEKEILGIGISVPGSVNAKHLILDVSPALNLKNFSFKPLKAKLHLPLFLGNDANAAALAELRLGIAKGMKNLVHITITRGVGGGIVIGGELYTGAHNRAGDMAHQMLIPDGKPCRCGKRGCWEQYVSEKVLLDSYNDASGCNAATIKQFFEQLSLNNPAAVSVWEEYIENLSLGIHNIISVHDPHYVVIGGNIAEYPQHLLPPLMKKVFGDSSLYIKNDTFILTSQLGKDASILGAALLPVNSALTFE